MFFRKGIVMLFSACVAGMAAGCGVPQNDGLVTQSAIEGACASEVPADQLRLLFEGKPDDQAAQLVARVETVNGCVKHLDPALVTRLYTRYGASFYDPRQPYLADRATRAHEDIVNAAHNAAWAAEYLAAHRDELRKDAQLWKQITDMMPAEILPEDGEELSEEMKKKQQGLAGERDDIFRFLARVVPPESLPALDALPHTDARDAALALRIADVDESTRRRLLKKFIIAKWHMQPSGSTALPQYLELDWGLLPMPEDADKYVISLSVPAVRIKGEEAKKRGNYVRAQFADGAMHHPDRHKLRVDLGPWMKTAETYRIEAEAQISIWKEGVSENCLSNAAQTEECGIKPEAQFTEKLDFHYRAFAGVETGAPQRLQDKEQNARITRALRLSLCAENTCISLWNGENAEAVKGTAKSTGTTWKSKTAAPREKLPVTQGHDFYLLAETRGVEQPVAGRLMARAQAGATWQEIGTFFTYPGTFTPPARANLDVSSVCRDMGDCRLELQLRPSLRMARRNPAIVKYWGDTIELGTAELQIMNRTPAQVFQNM